MSFDDALARVSSTAVCLRTPNVDTDVITPMHRIMDGTFVEFAFESIRFTRDGEPRADSPFDRPDRAAAEILLAGANFGCGSSRETAVWAVKGMGFRVVVAESFGDIFRVNCFRNAIAPIVLGADEVAALMAAADRDCEIVVDLETETIAARDGPTFSFSLPPLRRTALLEGLSDLDLALRLSKAVDDFEAADRRARPWAWLDRSP